MTSLDRRRPTAALALADGTVFLGQGLGSPGVREGELVFNTSITGYEEILTDPSYAGQIVTFTFPHVGNVGTNAEDIEAATPHARGMVVRAPAGEPSNWRSTRPLAEWLESLGIVGISGVDTRRVTRVLRDRGAQNAAIAHAPDGELDLDALKARAAAWPGLLGMDLATEVSSRQRRNWREGRWSGAAGYLEGDADGPHVVAVDYGVKRNILRSLAALGCRVTVVPATATAEEVMALEPDGVLLANGPGDPAATGEHAVPEIRKLVDSGKPLFGICLGHQLLGLAVGARTEKLSFGHHGANHPVKDLTTGRVEITSQNHGFALVSESMPEDVEVTHVNLNDGTVAGNRHKRLPAFGVQYHPEASAGPHDSNYLFREFRALMGPAASRS